MLVLAEFGPWQNGKSSLVSSSVKFTSEWFHIFFHFHSSLYCSMLIAIELQSSADTSTLRHTRCQTVPGLGGVTQLAKRDYTPPTFMWRLGFLSSPPRGVSWSSRDDRWWQQRMTSWCYLAHISWWQVRVGKQESLGIGNKVSVTFSKNVYMFAVDSVIHVFVVCCQQDVRPTSFLTGGVQLRQSRHCNIKTTNVVDIQIEHNYQCNVFRKTYINRLRIIRQKHY